MPTNELYLLNKNEAHKRPALIDDWNLDYLAWHESEEANQMRWPNVYMYTDVENL